MKTFLKVVLVLGLVAVAPVSCKCEDAGRTERTLRGAGYTNIRLTGVSYMKCGEERWCTTFQALGPRGDVVTGAVGCGFEGCGKGCTIRVD